MKQMRKKWKGQKKNDRDFVKQTDKGLPVKFSVPV